MARQKTYICSNNCGYYAISDENPCINCGGKYIEEIA